ncbi:hypothetical protein [Manganibacter manganicus]|uniref:Fibronectin type-III domain-containing protein n=1 Tax=Manganibacter manganicus TaxID=1873176 RepID=A0A1V8RQV9_9HYPH|nr:hypothetical protein [Pseudaminobacter manganicus]OQM75601.1 hypothetical protein BFN67_17670 [Pseudaminobacter manganicus]
MTVTVDPIANGESGASVRDKLNTLILGASSGAFGVVTPEDLEALIDTTPPAVPNGLEMSSVLTPAAVMTVAWDFNSESDFLYYDLQVREENGPWVSYQTSSTSQTVPVRPNVTYTARIRAVDKSGNASLYSDEVSHTVARDTIPPAAPIGLKVSAGIGTAWLKWTANTEADLSFYEVYESNSPTTPLPSDDATYKTITGTSFVHTGLADEITLHFWVRAVDTSDNRSPWSAGKSLTTSKLPKPFTVTTDVLFQPGADEVNRLSWTAGSITFGVPGETPTTLAVAAGHVDWSADDVYVYYVPGDTVLKTTTNLPAVYSAEGVILGLYKGGYDFQLVMGKALIDGGTIIGRTIGADQLVTDQAVITGTAQIADAIITNGKIVNLDVSKLVAADVTSNNVLVGLVNGASVKIAPGQIQISGSATLSSWIDGGDTTAINGAKIATGTLLATSAVFGMRNITTDGLQFEHNKPAVNQLSWTSFTMKYIGDDGNIASRNVTAGSLTWSSGTVYVYYVMGATALASTTNTATAFQSDRIILAVYRGGTDLVSDYGRTIIDGSHVKTGTLTADKADIATFRTNILTAGSISTTMLASGIVTASKMSVFPSSTIVSFDPTFADAAAWTQDGWAVINTSGTYNSGRALDKTGNGSTFWDNKWPINPRKDYELDLIVWQSDATSTFYGVWRFYDYAGNIIKDAQTGWPSQNLTSGNFYHPSNATTTGYQQFKLPIGPTGTASIPSNAVYASFGILADYGLVGSRTIIARAWMSEMVPGTLVVKGTITADRMNVTNLSAISADLGAVTAGSININNKFLVASDGTVTIREATTGARLEITSDHILLVDNT